MGEGGAAVGSGGDTSRGRPNGIVDAKHGPLQVFAAVLNDRPARRRIRRDPRAGVEVALNIEEAVLRDELLGVLHVERLASHGHARVRFDDRAPARLLPPLADLGKGSTVRFRRAHLHSQRDGKRERCRNASTMLPHRRPCNRTARSCKRLRSVQGARWRRAEGGGLADSTGLERAWSTSAAQPPASHLPAPAASLRVPAPASRPPSC